MVSMVLYVFVGVVVYYLAWRVYWTWRNHTVSFVNKHCLITGGSQGLGESLALELVKRGAHVTIVARRQNILDQTKRKLEAHRTCASQKVLAFSADVTDATQVEKVLDQASQMVGIPDNVFCCAGAAKPGLFLETPMQVFREQMELNYFGTVHVVQEAVRRMVAQGKKVPQAHFRVVIVSSTAALLGYAGNSQYVATKFALRGFADCLRNELCRYPIHLHIYYPPNMNTPGFEMEEREKPTVTRTIEGTAGLLSADQCAKALLQGIQRNQYHITADSLSEMLRISMTGVAPRNWPLLEAFLSPLLVLGGQLFHQYMDWIVRSNARSQTAKKVD